MGERKVHVVGAGGVGFYVAMGLSRADVGQVVVYDDDNLDGGLGHTRLPLATPATRKVDLLVGFLRVSFGGSVPEIVAEKFTGKEVAEGDFVVDCSDMSGTARRRIYNRVMKAGARYLRVSYDGANSTIAVAEGLPIVLDENASGYATVPSLALSLAAGGIGAEVVTKMANGPTGFVEFQVSLGDYLQVAEAAVA